MTYSYEAQEERIGQVIEVVMAETEVGDFEHGEIDFEEIQDPEYENDSGTEQETWSGASKDGVVALGVMFVSKDGAVWKSCANQRAHAHILITW